MFFASDNGGPAHPKIMDALLAANEGNASGYGAEAAMAELRQTIREVFEAPEAAVYLTVSGTSANALLLATLTQPWQTIFCADCSHIHEDECNAPEFFTGGAKLTLVGTEHGRFTAEALAAKIAAEETRGVHGPQRGPVSITQTTERGTNYGLADIAAIAEVAKAHDLPLHLDGARFANALVALGCTPAEMTWKAGVDAVSFGGTKNGCIGVEACILFDPKKAWEFELRRKRAGHLMSKHRYLSAQMAAYLRDGLWLEMARAANGRAADLAAGFEGHAEARLLHPVEANILFFEAPRHLHRHLMGAGATYYTMNGEVGAGDPDEALIGRLVCDWSVTAETVARFTETLKG